MSDIATLLNPIKSLVIVFVLLTTDIFGQTPKSDWRTVEVYELTSGEIPDTLEICGGEWFVRARANSLDELNSTELKRIKKKVAKYGCTIVYVDVKKVFTPRNGKLYILGLKAI